MTKNRLIWNSVLFLIITIISIPIAYAQIVPAGSQLYFLLINAAIIFVVLFILQSFLIKGKTEKETTSTWVIMILASLLLAYLFGRTGFLWQGPLARFFSIYVLVNAIIIGAVLYFLLGLLKVGNLNSPEGKTGYGILIFLVALIFAVKIGNAWIWDQATIKELVNFFFGNEGILTTNKNRIFVFIGSAVLLTWFFNFVALGKENTKINYALAIVFAAHMASGPDPYTMDNVKTLLLIIGTWVLGSNLSEKFTGKWKIAGYVIAFALVYWATSIVETAVTPEGKAVVAEKGWIAAIFSTLWGNKGWIFLFVIVLVLLLIIFRGEKAWEFGRLWQRFRRLIRNEIWKKVDEVRARTGVYEKAWVKRRIPPDMLPQILKENLVILFSLSNYMKRMYIWNVKFGQVKSARVICKDMYEFMDIHRDKDIKMLEEEIFKCRNGGKLIDPRTRNEEEVGVFDANARFCRTLNEISHFLSEYISQVISGMSDVQKGSNTTKARDFYRKLSTDLAYVERSYKWLSERALAYGNHQPIKAQKYLVLDQCNPYGWHEHQYKFIGPRTLLSDGSKVPDITWIEVNQYHEVLIDKYRNSDRFYNLQRPPRRVHPDEIKAGKVRDLWPPAGMMDAIINDWEGFIRNMRFGTYRPNSKSAQDYTGVLETLGKYQFFIEKNIPITKDWKTRENPAFDRRALVNTGLLTFVGRRNYQESYEDVKKNTKTDPYPAVSSYGMSFYIPPLVTRDTENIEEANEYLKVFLRDTGTPIESFKDVLAALGALFAEEKK